jgi:8-oxo-dGTP pyrophosphatase MutT (NUDIX family)
MDDVMVASQSSTQTWTNVDQACAIPFRQSNGHLEFCLITSSSGRWIFPKGFIDTGHTSGEAALNESYEEAGLRGHIVGEPLGEYHVSKAGETFTVVALLMEVNKCEKRWPEEDCRKRKWVSADAAAKLLGQADLVDLLKAAWKRLKNGR